MYFLFMGPIIFIDAINYESIVLPFPESVSASLHPGPGCWVKANVDQSGFYRVNYNINNWYLLISHLKGDLQSTVSYW